ncbi:glycosyl transferase [Pedobacter lusitanus]|uniref:Glycosyl transferase n=1 Tax=Pedobacter lusitanus TaxID=1503925 RepID=A0A0D0FYC2_9SPHI|nr:glycosyltransferase family 1 protein [Pedobacter lusitanus]KIO77544.1 glycosyl transferase [Pedobacter lusitanus]
MSLIQKRIKILLDAHIFDHSFQGTATYMYGLYSALVEFERLEIFLCAHDTDHLKTLFPDPRFKFVKLNSGSRIKRLFTEYPRLIREGGYDYAHFQYIVPFVKNCKFINTIHDLLFLEFKQYFPWTYRMSRKVLFFASAKRSDIVLTVSEYSKIDVSEKFRIDQKNIHVTPNAVTITPGDEPAVNIEQKYGISKYILYVSRFEPRKNHLGLLTAFLKLKLYDQGYHLVFIGSKKEKIEQDAFNELQKLIHDDVRKYIHFLEGISWPDLNAFYQQAEVFVFPSLAEGFGIPPVEAAMNGCKVVCSNQTAMSEFGFFKYLFNPGNQKQLEEMLQAALEDRDYPFEQIKQAISLKYNWKVIAGNFYNIINEDQN